MKKILAFISNELKAYKQAMDQYGTAHIIISESILNHSCKINKNTKVNKASHLHLVKPNQR